jgi:hypothetical protein
MRNGERDEAITRMQVLPSLDADGAVHLGFHSTHQSSQPMRRETRRLIRREVQTNDGRLGVELTQEHTIHYAEPRNESHQETDLVRTMLAGVVSFIGMCLVFSALGGSAQSFGSLPFYLALFFFAWWLLA